MAILRGSLNERFTFPLMARLNESKHMEAE